MRANQKTGPSLLVISKENDSMKKGKGFGEAKAKTAGGEGRVSKGVVSLRGQAHGHEVKWSISRKGGWRLNRRIGIRRAGKKREEEGVES